MGKKFHLFYPEIPENGRGREKINRKFDKNNGSILTF
jgi:hypothetical protein